MSQTIHMLRAVVSSKVDAFVSGINKAKSTTRELADQWIDAGKAINQAASRMGVAIGGALAGISAATTKVGFSFLSMKQQAEISFGTMLGSAQAAKGMVKELSDFAAKTPFELPGLLKSSQMLLAFGFQAQQIIPLMKAVGDAVSGLGGSPEQMNQVIRALGQIKAKGKASAEEMLQLAEVGIPAWDMLARKIGVSIPEAMKLVEKGVVDADTTISALVDGMNAKFGGLMVQQSRTFSGMLSTLKDNFSQAAAFVVEPLFDGITRMFAKLNAGFEGGGGASLLTQLRGAVQQLVQMAESGGPRLAELWQQAQGFATETLPRLVDRIGEWAARVDEVVAAMKPFGDAFLWAATQVGELLATHPELATWLGMFKVASFLGIIDAFKLLGTAILSTAQVAIPALISAGQTLAPILATTLLSGARSLSRFFMTTLIPNFIAVGLQLSETLVDALKKSTGSVTAFEGAWKLLGIGAIAYGMFKAADAVGVFGQNVDSATKSIEMQNRMLAQRTKLLGDRGSDVVGQAAKIDDLEKRRAFLKEQLDAAKKIAAREDEQAVGAERRAQKAAEDQGHIGKAWTSIATLGQGETMADYRAREAMQAKQTAEAAARSVKTIEDELNGLPAFKPKTEKNPERIGEEAAEKMEQQAPDVGFAIGDAAVKAMSGGGSGGGKAKKTDEEKQQDKIASALDAQLDKAENRAVQGSAGLKEFMTMKGVTADQVEQYAGAMKGVDPATAKGLAGQFSDLGPNPQQADVEQLAENFSSFLQQFNEKVDRFEKSTDVTDKMHARINSLDSLGPADQARLGAIRAQGVAAAQSFQEGDTSEEAFQQKMADLNSQISELANNAERAKESTDNLKTQIGDYQTKGQLSAQATAALNAEIDKERAALEAGKITHEQYEQRLREVAQTAQNVAQASPAASMDQFRQKLKELELGGRLTTGQVGFFTQQMQLLQQLLAKGKISLDQFNGALDALAMKAQKGAGGMGGGFGGMMGGMMGGLPPFLQQIFQMGFGGGQPMMLGTPGEWFQKAAQANVRNMGGQEGGGGGGGGVAVPLEPTPISRLASAVGQRLKESGPFVEEFDRVATSLVSAVNTGKLADMNVPIGSGPRPTPGDTTDGGMGTRVDAAQISLEFPNFTKFSNVEIKQIVDAFQWEMQRQGRSV